VRHASIGHHCAVAPPAETAVAEPVATELSAPRLRVSTRALALVVVGTEMLALALFGFVHAWTLIPREDEVLALFVGRSELGSALHQVIGERGGAPMHFVTAWIVVHLGGHLVALRIVSTAFTTGSLALIALLGTRLARDVRAGVVAATLVAPSWLVLFSSDFARMYAEFLFFGTLAPVLLLRALDHRRTRDWVFWWLASLGVLAAHPYGAFVLGAGIAAVLASGPRDRRNWLVCAVPVVLALPFWIGDLVLRSRFDVGVGGGGESLGSLHAISRFLLTSFRDAVSWHGPSFWLACVLAPVGAVLVLRRTGNPERVLVATSFALPIVALLGARADSQVSPETRHLIFLLPYVGVFLAAALIRLAAPARRAAPFLVVAVAGVIVAGQLHSAKLRTNDLFVSESAYRHDARIAAGDWLGARATPNALLMGYEPLFYEAWRQHSGFSTWVVARADSHVAAKQLGRYCGRFTEAAFVFDRENGYKDDLSEGQFAVLQRRLAAAGYAAKRFDDFLVVLAEVPSKTPREYIKVSAPLLQIAKTAAVHNGDLELKTLQGAAPLLHGGC
jgi:uncharacterized membrane protein